MEKINPTQPLLRCTLPGDPAPWFTIRATINPRFHFDSAAGRRVVLFFFGSLASAAVQAAAASFLGEQRKIRRLGGYPFGVCIDPADEAAAWERFIDVSPTPIEACPHLGNAYARAGEAARSLEAFERCVSFDPRNAETLFFLGLAYERAGRTDAAADQYSKSVALGASNTDSQLALARLSLRANRVADAGRAANAVLTVKVSP